MMQCPACGVVHPSTVKSCPCGFNFLPQQNKPLSGFLNESFIGDTTLGRRFAARLIDNTIALLSALGVFLILEPHKPEYGIPVLASYSAMFTYVAYTLLADGYQGGQSLGKSLFLIRVVNETTGQCNYADSIKRNFRLVVGTV